VLSQNNKKNHSNTPEVVGEEPYPAYIPTTNTQQKQTCIHRLNTHNTKHPVTCGGGVGLNQFAVAVADVVGRTAQLDLQTLPDAL